MTSRLIALIILAAAFSTGATADEPPCWIVVASTQLDQAIEPLCQQRRDQGYDVVVVHIEDIGHSGSASSAELKSHLLKLYDQSPGRDFLLLVGDMFDVDPNDESWPRVPPASGTVARMEGQPTDVAYGCIDGDLIPDVPVGRFPAGSVAELEIMVAKTLAFETAIHFRESRDTAWNNRINLIVGHPGGNSPLERNFAEAFVNNAIEEALDSIAPIWQVDSLVHTPHSQFFVHQSDLTTVTRNMFANDADLFSVFLGHSNAQGLASSGIFFASEDWASLNVPHSAGVLFSCGCLGSQIAGRGGEGYTLTGMRLRNGPVAAIGATGVSYAAAGKWAINGFFECLQTDEPPTLLADYWMAAVRGIARAPMSAEEFLALDQADGSRGRSPISEQRNEHLEMWILLGDPAMRIPVNQPDMDFTVRLESGGDSQIVVVASEGLQAHEGATAYISVNRPLDSMSPQWKRVRRRKPEQEQIAQIRENHRNANRFELATSSSLIRNGELDVAIELPAGLEMNEVIVRLIIPGDTVATGVETLTLLRQ